MRDFSRRCEHNTLAYIYRGEFAGLPVHIIEVAWHHWRDGFTWRVKSTFGDDFFCSDKILTPISGVDLGDEEMQ